jgi:hypothetical protein
MTPELSNSRLEITFLVYCRENRTAEAAPTSSPVVVRAFKPAQSAGESKSSALGTR